MNQKVSLEEILKLNLTPNQYWILKLIYNRNYLVIKQFLYEDIRKDLQKLLSLNYILDFNPDCLECMKINQVELDKLFKIQDSLFWELLTNYPLKVPGNNGGTRVLHAVDVEAKENQTLKKKYEDIIKGKPDMHNHIVKCLKTEVYLKKKSNFLSSMQELKTWINQRTWEKYSHLIIDVPNTPSGEIKIKHGERLI